MSGHEAVDGAQAGGAVDECSPPAQWREYQKSGITVRVPAEPPKLTPRAARALLEILTELSDKRATKAVSTRAALTRIRE